MNSEPTIVLPRRARRGRGSLAIWGPAGAPVQLSGSSLGVIGVDGFLWVEAAQLSGQPELVVDGVRLQLPALPDTQQISGWQLLPDQQRNRPGSRLRFRVMAPCGEAQADRDVTVDLVLSGGRVVAAASARTDRFGVAWGSLSIPGAIPDQRASLRLLLDDEPARVRSLELRERAGETLLLDAGLPPTLALDAPPLAFDAPLRWRSGEPVSGARLRVRVRAGRERWSGEGAVEEGASALVIEPDRWAALMRAAQSGSGSMMLELELEHAGGQRASQVVQLPLACVHGGLQCAGGRAASGRVLARALLQQPDGNAAAGLGVSLRLDGAQVAQGETGADGAWVVEVDAPGDLSRLRVDLVSGSNVVASDDIAIPEAGPLELEPTTVAADEPLRLSGRATLIGPWRYAVADAEGRLVAAGALEPLPDGRLVAGIDVPGWGWFSARVWSDGQEAEQSVWLLRRPPLAPALSLTLGGSTPGEECRHVVAPGGTLAVEARLGIADDEPWVLASWLVAGGLGGSLPLEQWVGYPMRPDSRTAPRRLAGGRERVLPSDQRPTSSRRLRAHGAREWQPSLWWQPSQVGSGPQRIEVPAPERPGRYLLRVTATTADGRQVERRVPLVVGGVVTLEAELPAGMVCGDALELPVWIHNGSDEPLAAPLQFEVDPGLEAGPVPGSPEGPVELAPGARCCRRLQLRAVSDGPAALRLTLGAAAPLEGELLIAPAGAVAWRERRLVAGASLPVEAGERLRVGLPRMALLAPLLRWRRLPPAGVSGWAGGLECAARWLRADDNLLPPAVRSELEALVERGVAVLLAVRGDRGWGALGRGHDPMRSAQVLNALLAAHGCGAIHVPDEALRKGLIGLFRAQQASDESRADPAASAYELAVQTEVLTAMYAACGVAGGRRVERAAEELEEQLVRRLAEEPLDDQPYLLALAALPLRQHGSLVELAARMVAADHEAGGEPRAPRGIGDEVVLAAAVRALSRAGQPVPDAWISRLWGPAPFDDDHLPMRTLVCRTRATRLEGVDLARDAEATLDGESLAAIRAEGSVLEALALDELVIPRAGALTVAGADAVVGVRVPRAPAAGAPARSYPDGEGPLAPGDARWVELSLPAEAGEALLVEPLPANAVLDQRELDQLVASEQVRGWRRVRGQLLLELQSVPATIRYRLVAVARGRCAQGPPCLRRLARDAEPASYGAATRFHVDG